MMLTYIIKCFIIMFVNMKKIKHLKPSIEYIIIACCTNKKPKKLRRLLKSLTKLNFPNIKTEVMVVDNDPNGSAESVCKKFFDKLNIKYIIEYNQGLNNLRNRALDEAIYLNATHIAFIDDDEIADKNWLINLVNFYNKHKNTFICSGSVVKQFDKEYPEYITQSKVFDEKISINFDGKKRFFSCSNIFLPLNIIEESNTYFSQNNIKFFKRLNRRGYKLSYNPGAVCYRIIDGERANLSWIFSANYNEGYSSFSKLEDKNFFERIFYIIKKFVTVVINAIVLIFSIPFGKSNLVSSYSRFLKNFGKLSGAMVVKK